MHRIFISFYNSYCLQTLRTLLAILVTINYGSISIVNNKWCTQLGQLHMYSFHHWLWQVWIKLILCASLRVTIVCQLPLHYYSSPNMCCHWPCYQILSFNYWYCFRSESLESPELFRRVVHSCWKGGVTVSQHTADLNCVQKSASHTPKRLQVQVFHVLCMHTSSCSVILAIYRSVAIICILRWLHAWIFWIVGVV